MHILSDANGLPLVVGITAANTHDQAMFIPLLDGVPAIRSRRGPRRRRPAKLHADKGYDADHLRAECRRRGIAPRIARRGIESSERLGRWRWKIERTLAWAMGYRRLTVRYERSAHRFAAFLSLAATLICFKRLTKLAK
jgi:transposase